jgi:nicotinate-nucleotide--dimethylbenzimidazole phosphoribosyltransferase
MASDNGVVEEGVTAAPQAVTHMMTLNFTKGIAGISVLTKQFDADLMIVDVGVNADINHPAVINKKIRKSTFNIAKQDAMTYDEAERAILTGIEIAIQAVDNGYTLLGAGEMGIGNTTTSAAVLCALTGKEDAYKHKIEVVKTALKVKTDLFPW